jgi:hypothetical protein
VKFDKIVHRLTGNQPSGEVVTANQMDDREFVIMAGGPNDGALAFKINGMLFIPEANEYHTSGMSSRSVRRFAPSEAVTLFAKEEA